MTTPTDGWDPSSTDTGPSSSCGSGPERRPTDVAASHLATPPRRASAGGKPRRAAVSHDAQWKAEVGRSGTPRGRSARSDVADGVDGGRNRSEDILAQVAENA